MFCVLFQDRTGIIGPFSTVKLTLKWQPTIPGEVSDSFVLSFEDEESDKVSCCYLILFLLLHRILCRARRGAGHLSAGFCLWVLVTPFASCIYVLFMSLFSNFLFVFCDVCMYVCMHVCKKSRLRRRKCRSTTRAPNDVMIKRPGEDDVLSVPINLI